MKKYKLLKELPGLEVGTIITEEQIKEADKGEIISSKKLSLILIKKHKELGSKAIIDNWLEEIKEKKKSIYELKEGDKYWYIDDYIKEVCKIRNWLEENTFNKRLSYGNAFLTKQEAEKELSKRKALAKIKKWIWNNKIKLLDEGFIILVDFNSGFQIIGIKRTRGINDIIFQYRKDAEKCLEECKNEWNILFDLTD